MRRRLLDRLWHAWYTKSPKFALLSVVDTLPLGPARKVWESQVPWYAGKYVERSGAVVSIDGCLFDAAAPMFSTFQRGCFWLQRYEIPERLAVGRFLDRALPVIELGGSAGMLSCVINKQLASPGAHVVVEANPELIPVLQRNRDLNHCSFSIIHAAVAYEQGLVRFTSGEDHVAGRTGTSGGTSTPVDAVTLLELLERFGLEIVTLVCDIEGVEIDLLTHEEATLAAHVAWIIVELHEPISGTAAVEGFLRRLDTAGFALIWERNWTRVLRNRRWSQEGLTGRRRFAAASRRAHAD